jgi:hypothetical protein
VYHSFVEIAIGNILDEVRLFLFMPWTLRCSVLRQSVCNHPVVKAFGGGSEGLIFQDYERLTFFYRFPTAQPRVAFPEQRGKFVNNITLRVSIGIESQVPSLVLPAAPVRKQSLHVDIWVVQIAQSYVGRVAIIV